MRHSPRTCYAIRSGRAPQHRPHQYVEFILIHGVTAPTQDRNRLIPADPLLESCAGNVADLDDAPGRPHPGFAKRTAERVC
ncbi:hypothetical protein BVI2075_130011 [Burkholderia vietnamiensis]|nr:hypothetical protein BVI2075_130011 [Burkholderia vietnamiensis]CAG9231169.1 hypothetical protein BVI1335_760016 [Burkholderia vietnamiensis]